MVAAAVKRRDGQPQEQRKPPQGLRVLDPPSEWTISEFIDRVDGRGGLLICETDDLASIDRAVAQYLPWLDYDIMPVVDIGDSVANLRPGRAGPCGTCHPSSRGVSSSSSSESQVAATPS